MFVQALVFVQVADVIGPGHAEPPRAHATPKQDVGRHQGAAGLEHAARLSQEVEPRVEVKGGLDAHDRVERSLAETQTGRIHPGEAGAAQSTSALTKRSLAEIDRTDLFRGVVP